VIVLSQSVALSMLTSFFDNLHDEEEDIDQWSFFGMLRFFIFARFHESRFQKSRFQTSFMRINEFNITD
jgi:hypothetical protein